MCALHSLYPYTLTLTPHPYSVTLTRQSYSTNEGHARIPNLKPETNPFVARVKAKRLGEDWSFVEWSILESVQ